MQASSIYFIAAAEVAALLFFICTFLLLQNRSLRRLIKKMQVRMERLVRDLRAARSTPKPRKEASPSSGYKHYLNQQLEAVREYHAGLDPDRDIMLDIDPATPLPRRVAAVRYALLLAEKEATSGQRDNKADWKQVQRRYEQIFDYQATYAPPAESSDIEEDDETEALRQELTNAKKRINNLERFKALYFDLEEKWAAVRNNAKTHFNEISQLAEGSDNFNAIETALKAYHANYGEIGALIEAGIDHEELPGTSDASATEIRHLRAVAADQHRIITELQRKLQDAGTPEQRHEVVQSLQGQLKKQIRFVQESETCIQLLEDELTNANRELEQLRSRMNQLPKLKTDLKQLRDQNDDYELQIAAVKSENRRLISKLQSIESAPPQDDPELRRLKKEIGELETRYAELEEKFLDLKLQG